MNQIKFSHNYPKLWNQQLAVLESVKKLVAGSTLHPDLIEYDTKTSGGKYYKLPQTGFLIQLIFWGNKGIPFCTLRRHTPRKEEYYRSKIGQRFELIKQAREK